MEYKNTFNATYDVDPIAVLILVLMEYKNTYDGDAFHRRLGGVLILVLMEYKNT